MIEGIIPIQRFEEVRTRIGEILFKEISNQSTLIGDAKLNAGVWEERFTPFDNDELPAVSVGFVSSENNGYNIVDARYICRYYIDVHNSSKASIVDSKLVIGDLNSQTTLQRICGLIRSILTNSLYNKLEFSDNFIETTNIESIQIADPGVKDGNFITTARIIMSVNLTEKNTVQQASVSTGGTSTIKLELTEKGYKFELNN